MCVVSMVADHYQQILPQRYGFIPSEPGDGSLWDRVRVPSDEIASLRREIESLKALLRSAKDYDDRTNQPDCEMESKIEFLRKAAALVGFDFDDVFERKG